MSHIDKYLQVVSGFIILFLVAFLFMMIVSCHGGNNPSPNPPPGPTPVPTPIHKKAPGFIGYSLPNSWQLNGPALSKALCDNGMSATEIEWTPYINSPPVCHGTTNATYPQQAVDFINLNRACGITTMISIANMNGCATTNLPDTWMTDQVNFIINSIGIDHVILSPISEPDAFEPNGKSLRWAKIARFSQWHGLFSLPDKNGAGPYWTGLPYDLIDQHYCSVAKITAGLNQKNPKFIRNTDCGTLLNPGPVIDAQLTRLAIDTKSNLLIYDFRNPSVDFAGMNAMGIEINK